jgi:hypothetical protein
LKTLLVFVVLFLAGSIIGALVERRRFRRYWSRLCTGFRWKRRFPEAPKREIRAFLSEFVTAFAFDSDKALKFDPDDKVLNVYRTRYPQLGLAPDAMELETFHLLLEEKYKVDLASKWGPDLTLGDIFAMTRKVKPTSAEPMPSSSSTG